jgi:hypothetical protein
MLGVPLRHASIILESLVFEQFLARTPGGQYRRPFGGQDKVRYGVFRRSAVATTLLKRAVKEGKTCG